VVFEIDEDLLQGSDHPGVCIMLSAGENATLRGVREGSLVAISESASRQLVVEINGS